MDATPLFYLYFTSDLPNHWESEEVRQRDWIRSNDGVTFEGPILLEHSGDNRVLLQRTAGNTGADGFALRLDPQHKPPADGRRFPGGPFVGFGPSTDAEGTLRGGLQLGVELAIPGARVLIASGTLETDFHSVRESLVLEVAAPGLFVLPSLAIGAGIVAEQGPNGPDVGFRFRGVAAFPYFAIAADVDHWSVAGGWSTLVTLRLGL